MTNASGCNESTQRCCNEVTVKIDELHILVQEIFRFDATRNSVHFSCVREWYCSRLLACSNTLHIQPDVQVLGTMDDTVADGSESGMQQ